MLVSYGFEQGVGGEYPASSTSASEAANEKMVKQRGPGRCSAIANYHISPNIHHSLRDGDQFRSQCEQLTVYQHCETKKLTYAVPTSLAAPLPSQSF